jgi:ribosomal protein L23
MVMKGKTRGGGRTGRRASQRPDWKKAVVTLSVDDRIELFEGV